MPGNGENARTSRIRPVRQRYRLANRMPKQGSNSRVSVSVHICCCECERVFACRSQCEWWEYSHIRIARARISLHFVLARRLSTHRTEFASGPQLRNRNCSSHCILASCFLGPFLSVSVLFWHAQRQSPVTVQRLLQRVERQLPTALSSADAKPTARIHSNTL